MRPRCEPLLSHSIGGLGHYILESKSELCFTESHSDDFKYDVLSPTHESNDSQAMIGNQAIDLCFILAQAVLINV